MEIVTEMVKEIMVPVVRYSFGFVKQQIGYMICYKARVEEMKSNIDFLKNQRDTIQDQVEADRINSVPVKDCVRTWLGDAEKTLEKAKRISENEDPVSKGCLNLKQRYLLGKSASQELQEINNLRQVELYIILSKNQIPLGKVGADAVSEKAVHRLPSIVQKDGFAVFGSRTQVYNNVLKALDDDKIRLMAICGMGGVGKTTMIEQLEKTAKEKQMFHWAFKAVVTAQPNMHDIQQEIADFMKLNFDVTSVDSRAERLGKAFKEISEDGRKKILIILDDLWCTLDLKQLGLSPIAFTTAAFKIIFTTRNKHVCTGMNVEDDAIFELGVLKREEASDLFQKTVDIDNCTDPELPKIAEDIVEECDGLPLAITTIAGALKRKGRSAWIDTLRRLRNSDIGEKLNAVLETSFKYLEDDDTREVFWLCCLYPEDYHIPIEELARYAIGLRLYKDIHLMDVEDVRNRTKACTEELTGVNLLLESEYEDWVKMHDIVRDFGLNRCKNTWLVKHGNILRWPRQDSEEPYKRISLECSHMDQLPSKMNCPNLELLKLTGNPSSEFPKEFYKGMKKLRVLDYQGMNNPLLPGGSFQGFSNLRTLSLSSCNLGDFSVIGNLKYLEILSFAGCDVSELPAEIGNLSQLKLLDLTGCMNLHIEEGVLQKLVNLEELYMRSAPLPYSVYKFTDTNCAALGARFEKLTALEFEFYENRVEARPTFFKKLKRFRMSMGCYLDGKDGKGHTPFKNTLMLKTNAIELSQSGIHELFKITEVLVFQVENANCICDVSNAKDFWNLKILRVEECKELVHLVEIIGGEPNNVFPVMVNLRLSKLKSLERIYRSPQSQHSIFRMLKELEVFECNKLKFVLTHSLVKGMSMLEHLEVRSCENIQEIMEYEGEEEEIMEDIASSRVVEFPNLRFLSLTNLRNLVSFCKAADAGVIQFPQLDKLELDCLPKITSIYQGVKTATTSVEATDFKPVMHPFFNQRVVLPKLEQLNINEMENLKEIWPSEYDWEDICVCTITKMRVRKCDSLVYLFPTNQIPQQLHYLKLLFCDSLDVIFDIDFRNRNNNNEVHCHEIEEEEEGCSCLSLTTIEVGGCKNFRHVWHMNCVNSNHIISWFKTLRSIYVWNCDNFIHLYTPSTANINLEGLESITIYDKKISGTWESDDVSVEGSRTGGQKMLCEGEIMKQSQAIAFPTYLSWRLHNLQGLDLQQCEGVDVAFEIGEFSGEFGNGSQQVLLPQLRSLRLWGLTNMTHVWKWNKLGPPRQSQASVVGFQNLTNVLISGCYRIKYLFAFQVAKHLFGLRSLSITSCDKMQTIVSDIENDDDVDEHEGGQEMKENSTRIMYMDAILFPQLEKLRLFLLPNLMHISGGGGKGARNEAGSNSTHGEKLEIVDADLLCGKSCTDSEGIEHAQVVSFANLKHLDISSCDKLVHAIPFYASGQLLKLEILTIFDCEKMVELFEMEEIKSRSDIAEGRGESMRIPRMTMIDLYQLPKLTEIRIMNCDGLIYLFTYSIAQTLKQLKRLYVRSCSKLEVMVKEEGEHTTSTEVVCFPSLQSLELEHLQNLKAFSKGINDFKWPTLDDVKFIDCPRMMMFTYGNSATPKLKYVCSSLGKHRLEGHLNFNATTTSHQTGHLIPTSDDTNSLSTSEKTTEQLQFPWCLSNLIEKNVNEKKDMLHVFSFNELTKLQQLEKTHVEQCHSLVEVFEAVDGTNNDMNGRPSVVKFPALREMSLVWLSRLKYIWKSQKRTVLEFTNLTKLSIDLCSSLKHVFTCSTVKSFVHLQELAISKCGKIEVIVREAEETKEEGREEEKEVVEDKANVFPDLKSLKLEQLRELEGFCLQKYAFMWPSLDTLVIKECSNLMVFTAGHSSTPELKLIDTDFGLCYTREDPNSFITHKKQQGFKFERWTGNFGCNFLH